MTEARGTAGPLEIRAFDGLEALAPLAGALDALNLASRRPVPFATQVYLRTFLALDEYAGASQRYRPLLLVALEGGRPVGFLPMRRLAGRWLGLPAERLQFLVTHDNERPHLAARPEDEARCAEAFLRHLLEVERGWSMLEWMEQEADSPLALAASATPGWHVRRHPNNPNATITCRWPTAAEWYRSLSRKFRASTRSHLNRLLAAGKVELVSSWDPAAALRLLDLHLGIEERSWKGLAAAGVSRHPRRVAFFRALVSTGEPMRFSVRLLLLDGLPIASDVNGVFGDTWYSFEGAFDEAYAHTGAGSLVFLATMGEALARGAGAVNLLNNYAHAKRRLGAAITETWAVQLFRPGTPLWLKARLGELVRRLRPPPPGQAEADRNLDKPAPEASRAELSERRAAERARLVKETAETLAACEGHLERLDERALLEVFGREPQGEQPAPVAGAEPPPRARRAPRAS
jgi:CelD/BcsL family acetyltransferase involved in cellulose biosynthesis